MALRQEQANSSNRAHPPLGSKLHQRARAGLAPGVPGDEGVSPVPLRRLPSRSYSSDTAVGRDKENIAVPVKSARATEADTSRNEPSWIVIILVIAFLSILALPMTLTASGLDPIFVVISAVVLVFALFGRD